jgi:predicted lipoprotein with Yx(FWY)xxD motif
MPRLVNAAVRRPGRSAVALLVAAAAVASLALAAVAVAKSFTLKVTKGVHVTNVPTAMFAVKPVNTHEAVAVGPSGFPVYTFQGETTHHIICKKTGSAATNCWAFWPPVSPSGSGAVSKQSGISGKLATFKNHGVTQLTLNGQPLYYFTPDIQSHNKHQATGDELRTFGSIWHVVKAGGPSPGSANSTTSTSTMPTTTYTYPAGY